MRNITDHTFELKIDRGELAIKDCRFENCTFDNCALSLTNDPAHMARVSRVELLNCYSLNSTVGPCELVDILVQDLKTSDLMILWGPLFTRVELKGKIGRIKINNAIHDPRASHAKQELFKELRKAHYDKVDWAIDISGARPMLFEIAGIPAAKIRRDPQTQIVVTRQRLHSIDQLHNLPELDWDTTAALELFLEDRDVDLVLVAPTGRSPKFYKPVLDSFAVLRNAGIAEPD